MNEAQQVVEQNRSPLRSIFKFRQESKLRSFLNSKDGTEKKYYTLAEVNNRIYLEAKIKIRQLSLF